MKIKFSEVFVLGTRAVFYNSKIILLLWSVNSIFALVLSLPIYYILADNLSHSLLGAKLAQGFDYIWYVQFVQIYQSHIGEFPYMIYTLVGIYILVQTFFLGGLISIFNITKKNHVVDFFYGSVKYWFRFLKVLLVSLLFFAAAFKINDYLGDLVTLGLADSDSQMSIFIFRSLRYLILIFLIGLVTIISDYSKVMIGIEDKYKIIKTIGSAIIFIRKNFFKIFNVFFTVAVIGAVGAVIYNLIGMYIPRTPYYYLILLFILQQMLIIFRLYIRMLFCSTEVALYKDISAEIIIPQTSNQ